MQRFEVFSGYQQFYVADAELNPPAPEEWTEEHVRQRHNTHENITALCPVGDITARVITCGPGERVPKDLDESDFEVITQINVPSGKVGIFGWPWEIKDSYSVRRGLVNVLFKGYLTNRTESKEDYYVVQIEPCGD